MKKYLYEVESTLKSLPKKKSIQIPEKYIGGGESRLIFLGLGVPQVKKTLKQGFTFTKEKEQKNVARIWDFIWHHSQIYEAMSLALEWFYHPPKDLELNSYWPLLQKWSERIDNWGHSDMLCGIYARLLELDSEKIYPALKEWNASRKAWLRRISIVSLLYYSSQRKSVLPFSKMRVLVEEQLDFPHYYVQKGVGWSLRELGNVYPRETYAYLRKNIARIKAEAFSAAIEKLDHDKKETLKKMRAVLKKKRRIKSDSAN